MEKLRKKNQTDNLKIKKSLSSNKKQSGRPIQQTRASGRQNLRA
jgi:hypothetical protein